MKTRFLKLALKDHSTKVVSALFIVFFCIVLCLFSFPTQLHAQPYKSPIFDSLELIPSSPTPNDNIKLVCHTTLALSPGVLDSNFIDFQSNHIDLSLYFRVSNYMADFERIDTMNIGQLSAGIYYLGAYAYSYNIPLSFSNSDTAYINFTVRQNNLGLSEYDLQNHLALFPNPASGNLNFTIIDNSNSIALEIFDVTGKNMKTVQYSNQGNGEFKKSIDVSDLRNGLYFCRFSNGEKQVTRKFVKE